MVLCVTDWQLVITVVMITPCSHVTVSQETQEFFKKVLRSPDASEGEFAIQTRPNAECEVTASGHWPAVTACYLFTDSDPGFYADERYSFSESQYLKLLSLKLWDLHICNLSVSAWLTVLLIHLLYTHCPSFTVVVFLPFSWLEENTYLVKSSL